MQCTAHTFTLRCLSKRIDFNLRRIQIQKEIVQIDHLLSSLHANHTKEKKTQVMNENKAVSNNAFL